MVESSLNVKQPASDRRGHSHWATVASVYEEKNSINLSRYLFTVLQLIILT